MPSNVAEKREEIEGDGRWMSQHTRFVCQIKEKEPDVVFLGDAIAQQFQFTESWRKYIEPLHCLNFGIADDRTENVLWRIENGEIDGFPPKVVVIMVGTQNGSNTDEEIANGIVAVVNAVSAKQAEAEIIVMGLLPCGREPNPRRDRHEAVNRRLAALLSSRTGVLLIQPDWESFLQSTGGGLVSHRDMHDYLLPTAQGYAKLIDPLLEELQNCLQTWGGGAALPSAAGDE